MIFLIRADLRAEDKEGTEGGTEVGGCGEVEEERGDTKRGGVDDIILEKRRWVYHFSFSFWGSHHRLGSQPAAPVLVDAS